MTTRSFQSTGTEHPSVSVGDVWSRGRICVAPRIDVPRSVTGYRTTYECHYLGNHDGRSPCEYNLEPHSRGGPRWIRVPACRRRGSLPATTLDVCDPVVATTGVSARGEHTHRSRVVPALTRRCLRRAAAKEPPGFTMSEEETTRAWGRTDEDTLKSGLSAAVGSMTETVPLEQEQAHRLWTQSLRPSSVVWSARLRTSAGPRLSPSKSPGFRVGGVRS
jgi:hypothetical protein